MFDMWKIFEDFVTTALSESLNRLAGNAKRRPRCTSTSNGAFGMQPDLLCRSGESTAAVIDAKYKAERPEGFPNADLYQMLAYCTVLGLGEGIWFMPKATRRASPHRAEGWYHHSLPGT